MTVKIDDDAVVDGVVRNVAVGRSENNDDDDNDDNDDDDNLKPLLDDTANDNNGMNNTLSTIGNILSSTNNNILNNNNNNSTDGKNGNDTVNNNNNDDDDDDNNAIMYLRIKSSYGDTEIEIPKRGCPHTTTVAQLKAVVRIVILEKERKKGNGNFNNNNEDRYLRLICKGRLLSPDESLLSEFKVCNNDVVHVVLAALSSSSYRNKQQRQKKSATTTATSHHQQQQRRRHTNNRQRHNRGTVVGPGGRVTRVFTNNNEEDDDSNSDDEYDDIERGGGSRRERRGFDRLRTAGLSRPEITAIRTYFNRHVDRYIEQQQRQQQQQHDNSNSNDINGDGEIGMAVTTAVGTTAASNRLHLDEPDLRRRRLLIEETWMTTQGAGSEFRLNLNQNTISRVAALSDEIGTGNGGLLRNTTTGSNGQRQQQSGTMGNDRDFIWGFCLGFFVGTIGLVWIWIPTVPQKQKLGILAGICFQFFLNKDNIMDGDTRYDNNEMVFENI